jgi:HAD superfamily hydrolase (TIGR01484 family)
MIRLISTDFDGTIHDHFSPKTSIAPELLEWIADAQTRGVKWVVNTGRMLDDVLSSLYSDELRTLPDYIVSVEREIHQKQNGNYVSHEIWNQTCHLDHQALFKTAGDSIERIRGWLSLNFRAQIYEDPWSPLCIIASHLDEADRIHAGVIQHFDPVPRLCLVRNSIYFRFAHEGYSKGTALSEIARLLEIKKDEIFAAGDHFNDVSMLDGSHAKWVAAPSNAIPEIKQIVRKAGGYLAERPYGFGVLDGLNYFTNYNAGF